MKRGILGKELTPTALQSFLGSYTLGYYVVLTLEFGVTFTQRVNRRQLRFWLLSSQQPLDHSPVCEPFTALHSPIRAIGPCENSEEQKLSFTRYLHVTGPKVQHSLSP